MPKTSGKARKTSSAQAAAEKPATRASEESPLLESPPQDCTAAAEDSSHPFPIVGIGASAGGLEAFEQLFSGMPANTGMAFIIVQHLDAKHASILSELVGQYTLMQVDQITHGVHVRPNHVYVIPPNRTLSIRQGLLHLTAPPEKPPHPLTVDIFFRTLAEDTKERSIAIILSGTGSDGTQGLRAIKEVGGVVIAQDPETTQFDGMPTSAINTGLVDLILPPISMGQVLSEFIAQWPMPLAEDIADLPTSETELLQKVFIILRTRTGHDFSNYKDNTILRRISRRMALNQIRELGPYVALLQQSRDEATTLFRELLIGVSSFFRDPEAFIHMEKEVIPQLFQNRSLDQPIRIWVPGCATGEEAYTIAILLREGMEKVNKEFNVMIFATDLDDQAIEQARKGVYPATIASDINPERLKRFFDKEGDSYQVRKQIRDMLVIAEQNVTKDPPFSSLDLISCRNLLIYFNATLQSRVLPIFHYALLPHGFLFLGTSETVGAAANLFFPVERKWKIYKRQAISPERDMRFDLSHDSSHAQQGSSLPMPPSTKQEERGIKSITEGLILNHYSPSCVVINEHFEILYTHGRTGNYLELPTGKASLNLLKLAKKDLLPDLTTTVRKVKTGGAPLRCDGLRIRTSGGFQFINLMVEPLHESEAFPGCLAVLFEEIGLLQPESKSKPLVTSGDKDKRITELEKELKSTKEYLQTTIEELESSNEELKSTNEEIQASNEELQSANEELETSKEESQSINEELSTVNSEYEEKLNELAKVNNDMVNYMASTEIGTVFLDLDLNIRRFTPAITRFINLINSDVGRPLSHTVNNLDYDQLESDAEAILETLVPHEKEIQVKSGDWILMRMRPYRTAENAIDGVVVTFIDISEVKTIQEQLRLSEERFKIALKSSPFQITIAHTDRDLRYTWVHSPHLSIPVDQMLGKRDDEIDALPGSQQLLKLKQQVLQTGEGQQEQIEIQDHDTHQPLTIQVSVEPLRDLKGEVIGVTTASVNMLNLEFPQ
uniref:Putative MCP methyltransferase/methylesterase, CheR/CheB with PAS/PAC sensor n=1 Tax=Magnetococcus massalia (strain MO-1) TaxID=451514 RepID=A0A1S7LET8_MAGMO|nr:putative MCP methyltransferase/methylesterase, CheR/CheB with PAS/PAC sensor [Candidatus Magnetococcus massalia]